MDTSSFELSNTATVSGVNVLLLDGVGGKRVFTVTMIEYFRLSYSVNYKTLIV